MICNNTGYDMKGYPCPNPSCERFRIERKQLEKELLKRMRER